MNDPSPPGATLVLADTLSAGRIAVDLESFLDFNREFDEDVRDLVDRWLPLAAPNNVRVGSSRR